MALTANETTATNTLLNARVNTADITMLLIICARANINPTTAADLYVTKRADVDAILFAGEYTDSRDLTRYVAPS